MIDCTQTIVKTEKDGDHKFDLIIGADGAGSVVRRCMELQIDSIEVQKYKGQSSSRALYLDNEEELQKYDPEFLHLV